MVTGVAWFEKCFLFYIAILSQQC